MNLKRITIVLLLSCPLFGYGQGLTAVMVDTNGVLSKPSNFWSANSAFISPASIDIPIRIAESPRASLETYGDNASASATNGVVRLSMLGNTTNGVAAVRLLQNVNDSVAAGVGTRFANDSHKMTVALEFTVRDNGLARFVLGSGGNATNFANYPTSAAIGFELDENNSTNRVRLIAHNGTNATNGPWVNIGSVFEKYTFVVSQNKTNGTVALAIGTNLLAPVSQTAATISGGPTVNAPSSQNALDARLSTTNTNNGDFGITLYRAMVELTD